MPTIDSGALQTSAHDSEEQKRTTRALTECMTTLPRAPGLYTVIGQHSGPAYTVDVQDGRCTCPDKQYNLGGNQACKHELRVRYATREIEAPDWIPEDDVDPLLGEHVQPVTRDGDLKLVDTGAGCLVYQTLTEERDGRDVTVEKSLLGYYRVADWDAISEAVQARGHGTGDALNLPEFESLEEAHAAMEAGA